MKFNEWFINSFWDVNYCKIILWRVYKVTLIRLLPNMARSRQFSVLSDNEFVKCQDVKGTCVSSWIFTNSWGPWVKVHSQSMWSWAVWRCCEALVTNWKSLTRWWLATAFLSGLKFEVMDDQVRETRHQLLTSVHQDLQQNRDTVDTRCWQDEQLAKISKHTSMDLMQTSIQTDAATQPMWVMPVLEAWC